MKLKTFVSFLLLFGAFSGTFLCVTTQQEDYNDVADNIWDHLPEESPQIEQNQDDSNNDNDNNKDPPTQSSVATNSDSTAITATTSAGNLTTNEMTNTTKNVLETITTTKTTTMTKNETSTPSANTTTTKSADLDSNPDKGLEMTMDPTTKMIIISGSVVGVIVLVLVLWLCYCCGLCSCICRLFSKLTKKRVKQQQFDIVDYDPKYPFFKPRNFKGKGAIIIQKQMTIPETPTDNQVLPADLNDVRINYTRKLCAVYEVGSEIEYVVDEFERPVKDSPRTKWFKTYEAKIKRGEYENDLNDSATPTDSERGTDIEQDGPSTED